jgi:hypothetical protein
VSGSLRGTRRANIAYEKEERDEIIGNIVLAEWELFQAVQKRWQKGGLPGHAQYVLRYAPSAV